MSNLPSSSLFLPPPMVFVVMSGMEREQGRERKKGSLGNRGGGEGETRDLGDESLFLSMCMYVCMCVLPSLIISRLCVSLFMGD